MIDKKLAVLSLNSQNIFRSCLLSLKCDRKYKEMAIGEDGEVVWIFCEKQQEEVEEEGLCILVVGF